VSCDLIHWCYILASCDLLFQCHVRLQETDGICSTEKNTISIDIAPNDVQLVRFPIVPMRAGEFTVDVIVLCVNVGDRIQKTLQVIVCILDIFVVFFFYAFYICYNNIVKGQFLTIFSLV